MIIAQEAREKVREFKAQKEQEHKEKILAFCEKEATEIIKQSAENGEIRATIENCPNDIRIGVIQTLRDKGNFSVVDNTDGTISVCW